MEDPEVLIRGTVLLDANHHFETQINACGKITLPICLLLFGCAHGLKIEVSESVSLPIKYDQETTLLVFDDESLRERVYLVQAVHPNLSLLGVLLINHDIYSFDDCLMELFRVAPSLQFYLTYMPSESEFELKCFSKRAVRLSCQILTSDNVGMEIINATMFKDTLRDSDNQFNKQLDTTKKLITKIDSMVGYLQREEISDQILRKLRLLVSQLKKPATSDIEQVLMDKEVELQTLNLLCEQWETAQIIKTVDK